MPAKNHKIPPLDPETGTKLISLAQNAIPIATICKALGLTETKIDQWIDAGQHQKGTYLARFADEYTKAQALGEISILTTLKKHAESDPTAAFKLLDYHRRQTSTPKSPARPLENQRQEAFARLVAKGASGIDAYMKVYEAKPNVARANAARLLANALSGVPQRVQALKTATATTQTLTMQERRTFLARVVKANLKSFDADKDGDLIEEITEENGRTKFKLHSKRGCVMDDARLAGELIDKTDLTTDGEPLPAAMPTIQMNVPASFLSRRQGSTRN